MWGQPPSAVRESKFRSVGVERALLPACQHNHKSSEKQCQLLQAEASHDTHPEPSISTFV